MGNSVGVAAIRIDSLDQVQLVKNLQGGANMRLLDAAYMIDSTGGFQVALAINGTDTLNAAGTFVTRNNTSNLNFVSFDQSGTIQWKKAVPANNINLDKFDMTFSYSDSLFVGLTFRDTVLFFNHLLESRGGDDIALVKITPTGNSDWFRNYGTSENETVSKLLYSYGIVFFGGEFTGSVGDKTIGKYVFSNLIEAYTKSYISYIYDEVPPSEQLVALRSQEEEEIENTANTLAPTTIDVYPNPFNNGFRLRVTGEPVGKVEVSNAVGQNLLHFESGNLNDMEVSLNSNGGLYLVKVYNQSGELIGTKKVVKLD